MHSAHLILVTPVNVYSSQWVHQRDQIPVTPRALRAPELITRDSWDISIDTWALGCLVSRISVEPNHSI